MKKLVKRFLTAVLILSFCLTFNVSALSGLELKVENEFISFAENSEKVAEIFKSDAKEITEYCKTEGIEYLAVNEKNTKQIRITSKQNEFTSSVINISGLSNDKISALLPELLGDSNIKGEILEKNGQKFIRTDMMSTDSGGKYRITEYITVADKESIVLSFYTAENENDSYIEACFKSFSADGFKNTKIEEKLSVWQYALPIIIAVFVAVILVIGITVVIDLKRKDNEQEETENE